MPTPVRKDIESKQNLRQTKKSLPSPLMKSIHAKHGLRKTKRSIPSPLRLALEAKPLLRKTKQTLPTPIKDAINNRPALRKTKVILPSPLRAQIVAGTTLKQTKCIMPSPLQKDIKCKHTLRHVPVNKLGKRAIQENDSPLPQPPAKKRRIIPFQSPSPYDFSKYFKPGCKSPNANVDGLKHLFKSPRKNFSMDPADNFIKTIFGSPVGVTFSSPVAGTAKKLSRSQVQAPCLKKTIEPILFNVDATTITTTATRVTRQRKRAPAAKKAVSRSTRSSRSTNAVATVEEVKGIYVHVYCYGSWLKLFYSSASVLI